jgi:hypothetical protein
LKLALSETYHPIFALAGKEIKEEGIPQADENERLE